MSQHFSSSSTYGRWYLAASYGGRPVEIQGDTYPDRMSWVEGRAAEVLAEIATSNAARNGDRVPETAITYVGRHVLAADIDRTSASAPPTVIHGGQRPSLHPYTVPRGWVAPRDLQSRCTAAARLTLTGKQWTAEDVAECASAIMLATLDRQSETVTRGTAADVLAYVAAVLADPSNGPRVRRLLVPGARDAGHVAPDAASMARLTHLAANWRRGEDRQRQRDATDAASRATLAGRNYVRVDDGETASPVQAARRAIDMLQNLGLDATAARRVWPLAYTAARGEDMHGEDLAAEVSLSYSAYKKAMQRARSYVPSAASWTHPITGTDHDHVWDYASHLEAVCAECEAIPTDPQSVATDAADGPDWPARSARTYRDAPITCKRDASVKRDGRRTWPPATWTLALAPGTRRRLETASDMKRTRADARTAAETETMRLAHGLPATVR